MMHSISESNGISLITPEDRSIYSVGISTGGVAEIRMAQKSPLCRIIATTVDQKGAQIAREKIYHEHLSQQIDVKIEDISQPLPYEERFFDFVYARLVLHYLSKKDLTLALAELHRVLKTTGKLFIVVRSKECQEARHGTLNPETGMTTYVSDNGHTYMRYFHDFASIRSHLKQAGFHINHIKAYDEQLCIDFARTIPSKQIDTLIEVFAQKGVLDECSSHC